jgi:hypothetical protein
MRPGSAEDMNSHILAICETQVRQTELISQVAPVSFPPVSRGVAHLL